jgi:hypothetical protein
MNDASARPSLTDSSSATLVGRYTWRPGTDSWWWSDGMYLIHGFEPGDVVPSTDLVLRHIHPDDLASAMASREAVLGDGTPFTFPHRIFTARRQERIVIAAGHLEEDHSGSLVVGHLVDVTDFRKDAVTAELDQAVADFSAHRAVIEQAKGVLMQLYSVDADTAWQLLRAYSQSHNRKVREVAAVLAEAATDDVTPSKERRGTHVEDLLDRLESTPPR